ncbi:MAG: flagellar protein FlbB [Eubacteriales bacterium]|nr:flagellar protein FlbB [Eubacteriales bacterium]MDN5363880.1 flagellar protein FlbB [Eubacteriales bacterium]
MKALKIGVKILVPLLIIAAAVYVLDWFGVVKVRDTLSRVPVVGQLFPAEKEQEESTAEKIARLEKENSQYKSEIARINKEKEELKKQVKTLEEQLNSLTAVTGEEKKETSGEEGGEEGIEKLAAFYAAMKPQEAVAIMNYLDDELVVRILSAMDEEQAGKILAAMEPRRAAAIAAEMTVESEGR